MIQLSKFKNKNKNMEKSFSLWWKVASLNVWESFKSKQEQEKQTQNLLNEKNKGIILNKIWKNNDFFSKLSPEELKNRLDKITKLLSELKAEEITKLLNDFNDKNFLDRFNYKLSKEEILWNKDIILKISKQVTEEKKIITKKDIDEGKKDIDEGKKDIDEGKQDLDKNKIEKKESLLRLENNKKLFEQTKLLADKLNLTQNPKYNSWQQEAKQKILSQKPELAKNPTDLNSLVNSYILISHQNELAAWDENLKREISLLKSLVIKSSYEDVFKWIAIDEAFKDKPWITNFDTQKAKASLIPDWNDVKIEWNKIESFSWKTEEAKQIIELDEQNSPKKFIEKNGYRLETTQDFLSDTDYEIQKEKFNKDYETQKANNDELKTFFTDFPNDYLTQNWISTLTTKLNTSQNLDKSGELRDLLKDFNQNSQELQSLKQDDPLAEYKRETIIDSQKSLKGLIDQKLKAISEQYFATNKLLSKIDSELKSLEKTEKSRVTNFRELQSQKDLEAEKTIDFLNNLWLTNIPQADLEYIFKQLNITQNLDPQLDINNWLAWTIWNPKQTKEYIYNTFSKIYSKLWYTNLDMQKIMNWIFVLENKNIIF